LAIEALGWVGYLGVGGGSKAGEGVSSSQVSLPPPWCIFLHTFSVQAEKVCLRSKKTEQRKYVSGAAKKKRPKGPLSHFALQNNSSPKGGAKKEVFLSHCSIKPPLCGANYDITWDP